MLTGYERRCDEPKYDSFMPLVVASKNAHVLWNSLQPLNRGTFRSRMNLVISIGARQTRKRAVRQSTYGARCKRRMLEAIALSESDGSDVTA